MKRGVALLLASAGLLVAPGTAGAKGNVAVTVCGAEGCTTIDSGEAGGRHALAHPHRESLPPPPASEYYSLRFVEDGDTRDAWSAYYVPGADLLATIDEAGARTGVDGTATWTRVPARAVDLLARATRDLRPFPTPVVLSAEVGFQPVDDPSGYLRLFEVESAAAAVPAEGDWEPVILTAARENPWTDGTRLQYSPSAQLLRRGQELVRLPEDLAGHLEERAALADGGGAWRGALVGGSVALAAVLVLALAIALRRAPRRRSLGAT